MLHFRLVCPCILPNGGMTTLGLAVAVACTTDSSSMGNRNLLLGCMQRNCFINFYSVSKLSQQPDSGRE
jgi:hypothetical protein